MGARRQAGGAAGQEPYSRIYGYTKKPKYFTLHSSSAGLAVTFAAAFRRRDEWLGMRANRVL